MSKLPDPHDTIYTTGMWLVAFAIGIVALAYVLKDNSRKGFSWWVRLIILTALLVGGHVFQSAVGWRGLPGFLGFVLFPLLPSVLADEYYYAVSRLGFPDEIAFEQSRVLALIHAAFVGLVMASMIFFWNLTRPTAYTFKYGDDESAHPSPAPTGKASRVTYGS